MIRNLRRRLAVILTVLLSLILIVILIAINVFNYSFNLRINRQLLRGAVSRIGIEAFCENPYRDPRLEDTEYSTVRFDKSGPNILINRLDGTSDEMIKKFAEKIRPRHFDPGNIHSLVYIRTRRNGQNYLIFMDNSYAREVSQNLVIMSLAFGALGIILLFFVSVYLSRRLTQPTAKAFETQCRFISDASHELKTPLTIIGANTDLLEREIGANQQLTYLRQETGHMNTLINQMLTLTRMDTPVEAENCVDFSLSDAWLETALPFESLAFENRISMEIDIEPHLRYHGVREQLRQLISILINNAITHTPADGRIEVRAQFHRRRIVLTVSNTGEPIPEKEREKIFERFYRIDEARSTGEEHYGLGLSIAKSIVEKYHGKISVACQNGLTTFQVTLPA